jgi:hypothetical protein
VKKAWIENLLPKIKDDKRSKLYTWMDGLMLSNLESEFNSKYEIFKEKYDKELAVLKYVASGWAGMDVPWYRIWPIFHRKFQHGHVNTTNLVEQLW